MEWFLQGVKGKNDWKVGTEHEKFAYKFSKNLYYPAQYDSDNGIKEFLNEIVRYGWEPILKIIM